MKRLGFRAEACISGIPYRKHAATEWKREIDRLMEQQLTATNNAQRKKLYDRVQEILAERQPMIFLASPDILAGAKKKHRQLSSRGA